LAGLSLLIFLTFLISNLNFLHLHFALELQVLAVKLDAQHAYLFGFCKNVTVNFDLETHFGNCRSLSHLGIVGCKLRVFSSAFFAD